MISFICYKSLALVLPSAVFTVALQHALMMLQSSAVGCMHSVLCTGSWVLFTTSCTIMISFMCYKSLALVLPSAVFTVALQHALMMLRSSAVGYMHSVLCIWCGGYCSGHRYCIHPKKSEEVPLNKDDRLTVWHKVWRWIYFKGSEYCHLGIHRQSSGIPAIMQKVQLGRRTMYSLMGAGVYGSSGLNRVVSAHLWKIYVIPQVMYGL